LELNLKDNDMPHTRADLEKLIQSKLDDELQCKELPYLCAKVGTEEGRAKIVKQVVEMVEKGMADIDANFVHLDTAMSEIEID
jgi:hypothetical protein